MNRRLYACAAVFAVAACAARTTPPASPAPAQVGAAAPVAAPVVPVAPPALRYTAGTNHYRIESQTHIEQEVMGQSTRVDVSTAAMLTVAVAEAADNLGVGITIDSLAITTPAGGPSAADLAAVKGQTVRLVTSKQGQTISVTPPDSAPPIVQGIVQGFREFLPQLPSGSPAAGTTWTDSSSTTTPTQAGPATLRMAREHRVVGWEDHGGTRALHVATTATYTLSGSGETQGQTIEFSGSGQRTADAFISAAGVYLGGTTSDSSLVNANVVSAGIVVPVRSVTHGTYTRLP